MCCAGGVSHANKDDSRDYTDVLLMKFFRDHFSRFVNHAAGKAVIFLLTVEYLAIAIWGCADISRGLQLKNLAPDDSYVADFYEAQDLYLIASDID